MIAPGRILVALLILGAGVQASPAEQLPAKFFDTHCTGCHNSDDANAGVRLDDAQRRDWSHDETSAFFERVLKVVRAGRMPPADAVRPSAVERSAAVEALHAVLMQQSGSGGSVLRRLNRAEYENTVCQVFGIDFEVPAGFPADSVDHGFDNSAAGLVMSAPLLEAYFQSAIAVADQIVPPPRKPVASSRTDIPADGLVISYSSGAVIDRAMRLAARTDTMWRSCTWPEKFEVQAAGTYRITVSASRFAPPSAAFPEFDEAMMLQIRARSLNERDGEPITKQRLLAKFAVTQDSPEEFSCVVELFPSETPVFHFANAPVDGVKGDDEAFGRLLRRMFANDPRLLAGWLLVEHTNGLRGGIGWDRVRAIRDSDDLELSAVDMSDEAVEKLVKKMAKNPGLYAETVIYQLFEEGPALQLHEVVIEGPQKIIRTVRQQQQAENARRFLGERGEQSDSEYVRSFLRRFLTSIFRRPATAADIEQYTSLVLDHVAQGRPLESGLHLAIRTALMSPRFLYRGHHPGKLDSFDLATRLSYFLTSGPPDERLLTAAESGALTHAAELERQARRLLTLSDADRFVADFTGQWLGTRSIEDIMPDARLFPDFTPELRDAMITETELFFAEILRHNLPLRTFIKPDFTFLNPRLAETIYGRDDVRHEGQGFLRVSLPQDSPYGGLLGQAAVMMATANGVDTQPVVRGVWVLDNIFGDPPPPPPDSVPALTPDTQNAKTVRELLAAHRSDDSCATCHRRIDPVGFVLENFDAVGRWRTHYPRYSTDADGRTTVTDGATVNSASDFSGDVEFSHVNDLKDHVVANIDDFANCLSRKLLIYATGRPVSYSEKQEVHRIVADARQENGGFQDLLIALIQSDAFGIR